MMPSEVEEGPSSALEEAIELCRRGSWWRGLEQLRALSPQEGEKDSLPGLYYTYLGQAMARCQGKRQEGLALCRFGVKKQPRHPENLANLSYLYLMVGKRRAAHKVMEKGLALAPRHPGLRELAEQIGVRRRPAFPFLGRSALPNRLVGRITYRIRRRIEEARRKRAES